jgi:hypothetical protein
MMEDDDEFKVNTIFFSFPSLPKSLLCIILSTGTSKCNVKIFLIFTCNLINKWNEYNCGRPQLEIHN